MSPTAFSMLAMCVVAGGGPVAHYVHQCVQERVVAQRALARIADDPAIVRAAWLQGMNPTALHVRIDGSPTIAMSPPLDLEEARAQLAALGVKIEDRVFEMPTR